MRGYCYLLILGCLLSTSAQAEPLVLKNTDNSLSLSIYNRDLALIKDIRPASLKNGLNEVIFDGVASQIQAETAIVYGDGIKVNEQNYSYNLMSYDNFINQSLGKTVRTVQLNPETGENIYDNAKIIGYANGKPILRFSYGIESDFPGRVVFEDVPTGMSNKPTLEAKLDVNKSGDQNLYLAYLTSGLSWKTDYVANVKSADKLDLTGWVTISNNSGIDYERAKIQLIAGDVNIARSAFNTRGNMVKAMAFNAVMEDSMDKGIQPENINSYELYTLPNITTIKDHQNKQIALIEKNNVTYKKEFLLHSPLYFNNFASDEFEKHHPSIIYVIENKAEANLGISLPTGIIRFYENDKNSNLQFIGSNHIANTAKEDTLRLKLGDAFNISVSGKVTTADKKEISRKPVNNCAMVETLKTYNVKITINNAEDVKNTVVIEQHFPDNHKITDENITSESKNASTRLWKVEVDKNSKNTLKYTVDITFSDRICN
ncbi:MAG: DUF4139 domain-containing protein [Alphaproteobacteria bacterium]|nr:DUF4139 domain-containing protein [Alphaproteobacteria bacterium]